MLYAGFIKLYFDSFGKKSKDKIYIAIKTM